ncbi:hypothetical protein HDU99_008174 [Rhizoclosmatium hyalinum]|nr:hypothetical protein HDU99_008174 [Rhizoclosmatium hyalinum]
MSQITELQGNKLSGAFQHPAVLGALQQRLNGLIGKPTNYIADLPSDVKRRVNALRNIQDKHSALEAQFREEVLALEKKYLTKHQPLFDQRAKIVAGDIEPSDAEAKREPDEDEDEDAVDVSKPVDKPTKGIPEFWLTALKTNAEIGELITEKDEEALKALKNIKYSYLPDNPVAYIFLTDT